MRWWSWTQADDEGAPPVSPETKAAVSRVDALHQRLEGLGIETRAVAREALLVRSDNHFGPALVAAFSTPRKP